jgi:cell division protein FtsI (penicillin-binding protein 3)
MTSVFATIANDGVRVPPTLVKGTLDASGKLTPRTAAKPERVLSVQAAQALRADMEAIATPLGTAPAAAIPNYRISGKTGTGQLAENNHYVAGNVTSMIGIVPADAPRYVIGIFVHASAGTGGAVAGPLFSELGKFTLGNYGVAPTLVPPPPIRIYAS